MKWAVLIEFEHPDRNLEDDEVRDLVLRDIEKRIKNSPSYTAARKIIDSVYYGSCDEFWNNMDGG